MSSTTETERDRQSFAEAALRLGGKTDEEARRTGAVDRADEQVESLFAPQYQTVNSPIHKAVWGGRVPLELFSAPPLPAAASCDTAMEKSITIVRQRREAGTLYDEKGKVAPALWRGLGEAGYWAMLLYPRHGGEAAALPCFQPVPFA